MEKVRRYGSDLITCHEIISYDFGIWNLLGPIPVLIMKLIGEGEHPSSNYKRKAEDVNLAEVGMNKGREVFACPILKAGKCGERGLDCEPVGSVTVIVDKTPIVD